jgi:ferrochelatase
MAGQDNKMRIAVVLLNMGGPDGQQAVRPFLRNLFSDPAIIRLPFGLRHLLAEVISRGREIEAKANYQLMGGGSPIVAESELQRDALLRELQSSYPQVDWFCTLCMRYWAPVAKDALAEVQKFAPDQVIALPLYPQFSTTTSASSLLDWRKTSKSQPWKTCEIRSYEDLPGFIAAQVQIIVQNWEKAKKPDNMRVLFSAHGLPEKIVAAGDPYPEQIQTSANLIKAGLPKELQDMQICFQSRVGPMKWIGPSTIEAVQQAGRDQKNVLLVPISFVSEHVETLVELDLEIADLAREQGIKQYLRVPTLRDTPRFMSALTELVAAQIQD